MSLLIKTEELARRLKKEEKRGGGGGGQGVGGTISGIF